MKFKFREIAMATLTVVFTATALRAAHEVRVDNDFPVLALSQNITSNLWTGQKKGTVRGLWSVPF